MRHTYEINPCVCGEAPELLSDSGCACVLCFGCHRTTGMYEGDDEDDFSGAYERAVAAWNKMDPEVEHNGKAD